MCLFPEMYFHSLRCVYTDWSAHTLPLQDQPLYKDCRYRASGLELLCSVENTNDSWIAALHVGDFPVLKSLFRSCDGTIPKWRSVSMIRKGSESHCFPDLKRCRSSSQTLFLKEKWWGSQKSMKCMGAPWMPSSLASVEHLYGKWRNVSPHCSAWGPAWSCSQHPELTLGCWVMTEQGFLP